MSEENWKEKQDRESRNIGVLLDGSFLRGRELVFRKKFFEQPLGFLQSSLGKYNRFRLTNRIGDVSLLVQTIHGVPVEALPHPAFIVKAAPDDLFLLRGNP
jgi:hypothetical protein